MLRRGPALLTGVTVIGAVLAGNLQTAAKAQTGGGTQPPSETRAQNQAQDTSRAQNASGAERRGATRTALRAVPPVAKAVAPITPDDYGRWERLGQAELSQDGRWLAYAIDRVNEENELRIRPLGGEVQDSTIVIAYGSSPAFSADDRWLGFSIGVSEDEREQLEEDDQPVHRKLGLLDLTTGDTMLVEGVASFAFSDDGAFLTMHRYAPTAQGSQGNRAGGEAESQGDGETASHAADLVVRELATGVDTRFGRVAEFAWQEDGTLLAMVIDAEGAAGKAVQLYDPVTGRLRTLDAGRAQYTGLAWRRQDDEENSDDDENDDLAVLRVQPDSAYQDTAHAILAWRALADRMGAERADDDPGAPEAQVFDPATANGFPADTRIVPFRPLQWSEDGATLFFGIKERRMKPEEEEDSAAVATKAAADSAAEAEDEAEPEEDEDQPQDEGEDEEDDEEPAGVLVWHAKDVNIIPQQRVDAGEDRRENYLAAWHLDSDRFVQLGNEITEDVTVLDGDRRAVGADRTPYDRERMFGPMYRDVYLINVEDGERAKVRERVQYFAGASPGGRYLLYLEDDHYWTYDIERDRHTRITEGVPTSFVDVEDDHTVEQKPPFGFAGWTEEDGSVLLYDKYDIWQARPDAAGAVNLTHGAADSIRYRYVDLRREEGFEDDIIDSSAPLYAHVYNEWTEESGYARLRPGEEPERLVWLYNAVGRLVKAEDTPVYLYAAEDFDDSPDYFVSGADLTEARQVTNTNPFQDEYAWGRSELVAYENRQGVKLQGALFYPADYDPTETYPMIVYIYEIRSPSVNRYVVPSERSAYNTAVFTSQGYFVLQPDIVYRDRNPGLSAVDAIVPAVQKVLETGMVDPERVGLVGHSWGGYQTAFTVTQTDIFRAAVAGAPLTNLVSMYHSIYWRTGGTDARIFEISQGRMEVPPWEDMEAYVANSPLHHIEQLNTPLLVGFGDDDGAVEFNQGVEFYNAARRAGKDLVLLVYEDENHGISREEADQIDYHRRVLTWFNHYLKDEPAPRWITEGIPYLEQMRMREEGTLDPRPKATTAAMGRASHGRNPR